jgi:hypothetical protein
MQNDATHGVILISIHAPTRGTTVDNVQMGKAILFSIHAPVRGTNASLKRHVNISLKLPLQTNAFRSFVSHDDYS